MPLTYEIVPCAAARICGITPAELSAAGKIALARPLTLEESKGDYSPCASDHKEAAEKIAAWEAASIGTDFENDHLEAWLDTWTGAISYEIHTAHTGSHYYSRSFRMVELGRPEGTQCLTIY